jgi:hypothetical protein
MLDHPANPPSLRSIEAIELLDEQTLSSGIQHLQIPHKPAARLMDFQIHSIGGLIQTARDFFEGRPQSCGESGLDFYWHQIDREIRPRVEQFASSIRDGRVDWICFWESIDYDFTFAAARLDQTFQLDEETKALRIESLNFGKAVFSFEADGIHTLGDLLNRLTAGLPNYRGFGRSKMKGFADGLREFINTVNTEGTRSSLVIRIEPQAPRINYRGPLHYTARNKHRMSKSTGCLTLAQIHLHNEISRLESIGVENLEQLLALFDLGLPEIRRVGKTARSNILKIAKCADAAITESGDMDWEAFARLAGFPSFPSPDVPLGTGTEFLASLQGVVLDLTTRCFDEVESATLVDRLIPLKKDGVTLEQLGLRFGVSRERIRQKQKRVIESISAAVLENNYQGLSFRFTQNFSEFWRAAAKHFGQNGSITYNEFIDGLTEVWKVERRQIIPHLPLIYAILTSNSGLPSEFNDLGSFPQKIFEIKDAHDLGRSFNSLHPTKSLSKAAEKAGLSSVDQLLGVLLTGNFTMSRHFIDRLTSEILDPLSRAVTPEGKVDWQEYYNQKRIHWSPIADTLSPASFVNEAVDAMDVFIGQTEITGRSASIYRLRTVPEAAERKTLDEAGDLLGCSGPQIKREENELLERLHDAVFADDYTAAGVHFRTSFTQQWKRARKIYRQTSSQSGFVQLLSMEWDLPIAEVLKIVPLIACVVEGRPKGYTGKRFSLTTSSTDPFRQDADTVANPSVVRLRGFRSVH